MTQITVDKFAQYKSLMSFKLLVLLIVTLFVQPVTDFLSLSQATVHPLHVSLSLYLHGCLSAVFLTSASTLLAQLIHRHYSVYDLFTTDYF